MKTSSRRISAVHVIVMAAAVVVLLLPGARRASAAGPGDPPGLFWFGCDLGAGQLNRSTADVSESKLRFYLGLEGGFAVTPQLLVGIQASGWLIEPGDYWDPTKGRAISPIFVTARIYPSKFSTFHIRLGGGAMNAWDNAVGGFDRWGSGWEVGAGYDLNRGGRHHFTPFALYTQGRIDDLDLHALTFGVGYTWR